MGSTWDILGPICAVVAAICAVIVAWQNRLYHRRSIEIATAQGVFKHSNISISLFKSKNITHFVLMVPLRKDGFVEVPIQFAIHNEGDRSARKVEIMLRLNKYITYYGYGRYAFPKQLPKGIKSSVASETDYLITYMLSMIEDIHPGQFLDLQLPMSFRESTMLRSEVIATTKDGVPITVKYQAKLAHSVDTMLSQEDVEPFTKRFSIEVLDTSNSTPEVVLSDMNRFIEQSQTAKYKRWDWKSILSGIHRIVSGRSLPHIEMIGFVIAEGSVLRKDSRLPIWRIPFNNLSISLGFRDNIGRYCIPDKGIGLNLLSRANVLNMKQSGYALELKKRDYNQVDASDLNDKED